MYYTNLNIMIISDDCNKIINFCEDFNEESNYSIFRDIIIPKSLTKNSYYIASYYEVDSLDNLNKLKEDFIKVCKNYPKIEVKIEGQGESIKDWWLCLIKNCEIKYSKATVIPPWEKEMEIQKF